jgi:hypothetical protein
LRPYSPGGALNALASTPKGSIPPASSAHRLRRGLPGYLILFAPHAFAPQRQIRPSWPPSPQMFLRISTHSTATPGIPPASACLQPRSIPWPPGVEPRAFTVRLTKPPTCALRPIIPNNARTLRITAAAGTELAGASSGGTVIPRAFPPQDLLPSRQRFTLRKASSRTRRRCVSLSAIAQDSPLLPPVGVWAVSQSQCGGPSSQTPYASSPW